MVHHVAPPGAPWWPRVRACVVCRPEVQFLRPGRKTPRPDFLIVAVLLPHRCIIVNRAQHALLDLFLADHKHFLGAFSDKAMPLQAMSILTRMVSPEHVPRVPPVARAQQPPCQGGCNCLQASN
jgi:hypothetical protein